MISARSAVVVGGAGFIGARLCTVLAEAGVTVRRVVRTDPVPTTAELRAAGTVFLLASSTTPLTAEREPERCAADLAALQRVVEAVGEPEGAPHVVLASSGGACYDADSPPPYREGDPISASSAYAALKLDQERVVADSGVPATVLRLSNVYGRGQRAGTGQGVIAHWLDALTRGEPLRVYGSLDAVRDYLYLDDLMDLMVRLHRGGQAAPVLNVGSGRPTTLREVAGLVAAATGAGEPELARNTARAVDRRQVWLDVDLAHQTTGWSPRTPLSDGIRRTCAAFARR